MSWACRVLSSLAAALCAAAALAQVAPPPRSTADILAILDEHKPDPARLKRLREEIAKPPPQTTDRVDLRRFYTARGEAAGELGLVNQQLEDLRKALELLPPGDPERWSLYVQVGWAEMQAGNYAAAVKMWNEAPSAATLGGQKLAAHCSVAGMRAGLGDLAGARKALSEAQSLLTSLNGSRFWTLFADNWQGLYERARGQVLRAEGKHAEAEVAFRQTLVYWNRVIENHASIARNAPSAFPPLTVYVRAAIAWESGFLGFTLLEQGKFAEAELAARNALKRSLATFGKYAPETGAVLVRLGRFLYEQGRFEEAAALFAAAVSIYDEIGAARHSFGYVNALRGLGATLVEDGKYAEADKTFQRMREGLMQNPEALDYIGGSSVLWVYALVRLGRAEEALEHARRIHERNRRLFGDAFYWSIQTRGFYALALAAAGRDQEALAEFRTAVPALLAAASERSGEEGIGLARALQLKRILEAYIALLGKFAAEGKPMEGFDPVAEAFLVADAARGSAVQQALTAAAARGAIRDPELAKLAREEQDTGQRVGSLTNILVDLLSRRAEKQLPAVIEQINRDIDGLRKRRTELKREIEKRFPGYANLIDPKPAALEAARKTLAPGEAMIVLYGSEDRTFVWAVPQQGQARFHAAALGRAERDALVATLRRALDVGDRPLELFPAFDLGAAHKLYNALLAPLESVWGGAKSLLIVPHGSLGQLPFAVLLTKPGTVGQGALAFEGYKQAAWLVQRAAITQLPSVNTLVSLRSVARARAPSQPFVGFGDPVFGKEQVAAASLGTRAFRLRSAAFSDPAAARKALSTQLSQLTRLPDTAEELQGIAKALGAGAEQNIFLGPRASEQAVKNADLSERRVIAFATHGLIPGELDGLTQPALALSNPAITGEKDADGLLAMDEILALKLNADWVVLSACNTASAGGASEEAVSGLGRAFFYAGARALLVTNWPVETVSAKLLTTDIFRRQAADAKLARAEALRQAMLHLMQNETGKDRDGKPLFSYAHPMFWAPFSLVGDGG